jgi:hypothetical protein
MTSLITPEDLAKRVCSGGVLYSITLRKFGTNKKDKEATAKAKSDFNVSGTDSVATYKKLFKSPVIQRLNQCDTAIYAIPREYGTPWGDGTYFIPASKYIEMTRKVKAKLAERELIIKELANELTMIKAEAKTRLGTMYNDGDYPSEAAIISRYTYETHTAQITTPNGSLLGVIGDAATAVMNDVQESFNEQLSSMLPFIRQVILDPLTHLSSVLQNPNTKLLDVHFTNVWEAGERAAGLNVADNPEIAAAVHAIDTALHVRPDSCRGRNSKTARALAASDAAKVIELLGGVVPPPAPDSFRKDEPLSPCDPAPQQPETPVNKDRLFVRNGLLCGAFSSISHDPDYPMALDIQGPVSEAVEDWIENRPKSDLLKVTFNESPIMNDKQIDAVADAAPAIEEAEPVTAHTSAEDILSKLGW